MHLKLHGVYVVKSELNVDGFVTSECVKNFKKEAGVLGSFDESFW